MSRRDGRHLALVAPPAPGAEPQADDHALERPAGASPFDALYAEQAAYVARLAGRILGRDDEVADVVQEVFIVAHRRLGQLRDPAAARAWLARVTVREASRRLRWRRTRRFLGLDADVAETIALEPDAAPDLRPLAALLYVTLDRVPARERVAWVLRHLLDEPLDSVAEICGCSLATAKRRIAAAEQVLRPIVGDDEPKETP